MSYTLNLTNEQISVIINSFQNYFISPTNNYTLFRAKYKDATLTLYKTKTLLIQGSKAAIVYQDIGKLLNLNLKIEEKPFEALVNLSIIGTDEVGTGDFFGPIVVAGAFISKSQIIQIMNLGVKDSKELSDEKAHQLAAKLKELIKYQITVLDNLKYNYLTVSGYNLNKIKALLHNDVILKLTSKISKYDSIIIDAFTSKDRYLNYLSEQKTKFTDVELIEKAESKYLAVAAASILARSTFLKELEKLSSEIGFDLPKGASSKVDLAISKIIKEQSEGILKKYGKINFKNLEKAKNNQ